MVAFDKVTGKEQWRQLNRGVCWSHPAYANRHTYIRNDEELVYADLSKKE